MPYKNYALLRTISGNPIVDKRKGDRHKPGYIRPNPTKRTYVKRDSKWERRSIVAWDGEGANLDDGSHVYNLLANSNGDYILDLEGLATLQIFDFFMEYSDTNDINVIFGGSYDVNMILKDVPKYLLERLWTTGKCYWKNYRIIWATRKKFTVQSISSSNKVIKTFVLWDVIGYFQSSFVVACLRWLGDLDVLKDIQSMKLLRSTFKSEDIDEIIAYCMKECQLLVLLITLLFESIDEAELQLMRYDGSGSIAAAILKKNEVKEYKGKIPASVNRQAQFAYSAGRIEAIKCGTTIRPTKIYRYDINSAYPYACLSLPSYVGAKWRKAKHWHESNNSLVSIKYHFREQSSFYPLWYRDNYGNISYPRNGRGVYWGAEVANLFKYYEEGIDFEVEWAINCTLDDDTKPFAFLEELFELRKKFKSEGSMASESLKLGMNSVYGKLVQQAGYREGRIPTYHQFLWGGQITAYTRAKLFDAAMQAPKEVISFATDAIFTTKKLQLSTGGELGEWSEDEFQGITIVQAGVYFLDCSNHHTDSKCKHCGWLPGDSNDRWYEKFRGFDKGSLDRDKIIHCWETGEKYEAKLTRFVGLGSSLASTDFSIWRTWKTEPRSLDINPTGKRIAGTKKDYHKGLRVTQACPNITPDIPSAIYPIEWLDGIKNSTKQTLNGIPLEILVEEDQDGML
jgi:hypothetical protein